MIVPTCSPRPSAGTRIHIWNGGIPSDDDGAHLGQIERNGGE